MLTILILRHIIKKAGQKNSCPAGLVCLPVSGNNKIDVHEAVDLRALLISGDITLS